MEILKASEIAAAVNGKLLKGAPDDMASGAAIDSRKVREGDVFFALIGARNDGHSFIPSACERGASVIVISEQAAAALVPEGHAVILTDDTLRALQDLSAWYAGRFGMRYVAVTGSVGKTSTRDLLYACVSGTYSAGVNKANLNSETGLPMTLLTFTHEMEVGVLEMGSDGPGQISRLAELAPPETAVITTIGISHLLHFGSRENIMKAKMEITEGFGPDNTLVINADNDLLSTLRQEDLNYRLVRVGHDEACDYVLGGVEDEGDRGIAFSLRTPAGTFEVRLPLPGAHNAMNAALAVAAAVAMGVGTSKAVQGLRNAEMTGNRLRIRKAGGLKVIDDTYNAAPESMRSALDTLMHTAGERRIAILGQMAELGTSSEEEHQKLGEYIAGLGLDQLIVIGDEARGIEQGARGARSGRGREPGVAYFGAKEELYPFLKEIFRKGDTILLKASRSVELEALAARIEAAFAEGGREV